MVNVLYIWDKLIFNRGLSALTLQIIKPRFFKTYQMEIPYVVISGNEYLELERIKNEYDKLLKQSNSVVINYSYGSSYFYSKSEFDEFLVKENKKLKTELDNLKNKPWYKKLF